MYVYSDYYVPGQTVFTCGAYRRLNTVINIIYNILSHNVNIDKQNLAVSSLPRFGVYRATMISTAAR